MEQRERELLCKIVLHEGIYQAAMRKHSGHIGSDVERDLDEAEMDVSLVDVVLDYLGCPADNTVEVGCECPDSVCRDHWYETIVDADTIAKAKAFVAEAELFAEQMRDCNGSIAEWERRYSNAV